MINKLLPSLSALTSLLEPQLPQPIIPKILFESALNQTFIVYKSPPVGIFVDVVNETYTEILAITLNSIMCSLINNIDLSVIINYEIIFTHFQIAKIINFFGGDTYEDLFKITINQKTSVASYVIIKGMFLNNYEKILKHFDNLNFGNFDKKRIFNDYKKLYCEIVNKESLNKELINHFLSIIKDKNDKNDKSKEKFIMKTMRMTIIGFD